MALLIDGYNLLHATGIFGHGRGPGTLERSRRALLDFLVATIAKEDLGKTTVVFDAKNAPPGLPKRIHHRGILVCFAPSHAEADDLIEELIRKDSAPRRLTVVSSDHRLHRAARRRRAKPLDSDVWYESMCRRPAPRPSDNEAADDHKPAAPLSAEDVGRWLDEFGAIDVGTTESNRSDDPHDLWFWIHGKRHDLNVARALAVHAAVADVASLALEQHGYLFRDSRDLTGFIDGTANPKEDARRDVALVPEGKPGAAGSFVLAQQWVHDLTSFHAMDETDQERVIGRTKPDSIELSGDAMPLDSHVSRTDLKKDGVGVKIYRRSAPFGGVLEHGLYFWGFAGELERFDLMLASMFGTTGDGLHDRLIEYSRATTGAYYFAPSQPGLNDAITCSRGAAK